MYHVNFMNNFKRKIATSFLFWGITLSTMQAAPVYATSLDPTFGTNGRVTTDFSSTTTSNRNYATIVDSQGRILAGGNVNDTGVKFALARYLANGSLDTSFGNGGKVILPNPADPSGITSLVEQSDGKYVAVGTLELTNGRYTAAVLRFNEDGTLDNTFGSGGIATVNTRNMLPSAVTLDSEGRIVFTGSHRGATFVARYTTDGIPDTTFSKDGFVRVQPSSESESGGTAIGIDSNGKIVVGGYVSDPSGSSWLVQRYKKNGSLDKTFNTTGQAILSFPENIGNSAYGLAIKSDNSIYLGGVTLSLNYASNGSVIHVLSDGTLDTTYGSNGIATAANSLSIWGIKLDSEENVVGFGTGVDNYELTYMAVRFTPLGTLDSTFGNGGYFPVRFGNSFSIYATSLAIQSDGCIVGGGHVFSVSEFVFALTRIIP